MKFKDFALGVLFGMLLWVIVSLILMYFKFHASVLSLAASFVLCFLSLTVYVLITHKDREALANIKKCEKELQDEHDRLKIIVTRFDSTIARHNAGYEEFSKRFFADFEIFFVLKSYAMIWVYQSSMGKLRCGKKEKALEQIEKAEQILKAIIDDPIKAKKEVNESLNKIKIVFTKMLQNSEKQTCLPPRLYHIQCSQDLTCEHCNGEPVRQGDFKYRKSA